VRHFLLSLEKTIRGKETKTTFFCLSISLFVDAMVCQQMRVRFYTREVNLGLQIVVIDFACASIAASLLRDVGGKKLLHGVSWLHFWGAGRGAENVFFSVKILQPV